MAATELERFANRAQHDRQLREGLGLVVMNYMLKAAHPVQGKGFASRDFACAVSGFMKDAGFAVEAADILNSARHGLPQAMEGYFRDRAVDHDDLYATKKRGASPRP